MTTRQSCGFLALIAVAVASVAAVGLIVWKQT